MTYVSFHFWTEPTLRALNTSGEVYISPAEWRSAGPWNTLTRGVTTLLRNVPTTLGTPPQIVVSEFSAHGAHPASRGTLPYCLPAFQRARFGGQCWAALESNAFQLRGGEIKEIDGFYRTYDAGRPVLAYTSLNYPYVAQDLPDLLAWTGGARLP